MRTDNKVYEVLKRLRPYDIDIPKVRIGGSSDGGYILARNTTPDQVVLSYGLGGEISFDAEMAANGHPCYMFDHTISGLPSQHPNFHFYPHGVAGATEPDKSLYTVQDHLDRFAIPGNRLILKMDVEGAEWDVMSRISEETITRFEQIAIEVHDFHRLSEPDSVFLDKVLASLDRINRHFTLFHVHANNNNPMQTLSGFPVYNLLELSYIKTDIAQRAPSRTLYPTEMDNPNEQDRDDYVLSAFPFWPEGLDEHEYDAHARRVKAKNDAIVKSTLLYKEALQLILESGFGKAEARLRECLGIRPGHASASIELVRILNTNAIDLYGRGRFGDAVAVLREMLTLLPDHPGILENLRVSLTAEAAALGKGG